MKGTGFRWWEKQSKSVTLAGTERSAAGTLPHSCSELRQGVNQSLNLDCPWDEGISLGMAALPLRQFLRAGVGVLAGNCQQPGK